MTTRSKLPFALQFTGKTDGRPRNFTRFTKDAATLLETMTAGMSLSENQDISLHFTAPAGFRFTMDGLDVVTISGAEKENGQTWLRPMRPNETVTLFEGRDFPLVPGYYVITVTGRGRIWYGLLEITPKFMGRQSWQDMAGELVEEIKNLSFDFMKRSIHISKSVEGALGASGAMLLRFYTIADESDRVLKVLSELARTANSRLTLRRRLAREGEIRGAHTLPRFAVPRPGAERELTCETAVTWNVAENRFAKSILLRLDETLGGFIREIDSHAARLAKKQEELRDFYRTREYKTGQTALTQFENYRQKAEKIRAAIRAVTVAAWFEGTSGRMPEAIPMTVFRDPRYSLLYRLHRNLKHPEKSLSVAPFYQFRWKRTDRLYELWCFLQFIKALEEKGWDVAEGPAVIKEDGRYRLSSLEAGTEITLTREDETVRLTYDGLVPSASADTDRAAAPLYTNNVHRRPDFRMDYYKGNLYYGSLAADFKYRDIYGLWQDEARSAGLRHQFNAYRDMNTRFYRDMDEAESLRSARPVKEVWAIFPRELPPRSDEDFSLKFISLAPGLKGNRMLGEMIEEYIASLGR